MNSKDKSKNVLLIFVKEPVPGKVKTRLHPEMTYAEAAGFYKSMQTDIINTHLNSDCYTTLLYCSDNHTHNYFSKFYNESVPSHFQNGKDLGERMLNAISQNLNSYRNVVIIGSDCPGISQELICTAFQELKTRDIVLGPSEDGGYYLLGSNKVYPGIFSDVTWSTEKVFTETLSKINGLNLNCSFLPEKYDIDTFKDTERLFDELENNTFCLPAPYTQNYLLNYFKKRVYCV